MILLHVCLIIIGQLAKFWMFKERKELMLSLWSLTGNLYFTPGRWKLKRLSFQLNISFSPKNIEFKQKVFTVFQFKDLQSEVSSFKMFLKTYLLCPSKLTIGDCCYCALQLNIADIFTFFTFAWKISMINMSRWCPMNIVFYKHYTIFNYLFIKISFKFN